MAKHFGNHPAVIGWQIDNEIGHEGSDIDHSQTSLKAFRVWLKNKYKTIRALNESWGNVFWEYFTILSMKSQFQVVIWRVIFILP